MIAVDDGSTDSTAEVIDSYVDRFHIKGYTLTRLSQPNSGQSVAIARALPLIRGEYLVWPDSDDFFASPQALAKMLTTLANQPDSVGMVRTWAQKVKNVPGFPVVHTMGPDATEAEDLFDAALLQTNGFYYCSGAYMMRTNHFRQAVKGEIFTSKSAGQNYQLVLPMLYHYRCITIPEVLFSVVINPSSHSRDCRTYDRLKNLIGTYIATVGHTLRNIRALPADRLAHYERLMEIHFTHRLLLAAMIHCRRADVAHHRRHLAALGALTPLTRLRLLAHRLGYYRLRKTLTPKT